MEKLYEGVGGIGVTMYGMWFDPFEMQLWGFASCCDCL